MERQLVIIPFVTSEIPVSVDVRELGKASSLFYERAADYRDEIQRTSVVTFLETARLKPIEINEFVSIQGLMGQPGELTIGVSAKENILYELGDNRKRDFLKKEGFFRIKAGDLPLRVVAQVSRAQVLISSNDSGFEENSIGIKPGGPTPRLSESVALELPGKTS